MLKSTVFDKCVALVEQLLHERKLHISNPYRCEAKLYFTANKTVHTAIIVSTVEGQAGTISRAWAGVWVDPDRIFRCSDVHISFYGESVVLGKLLQELDGLRLKS